MAAGQLHFMGGVPELLILRLLKDQEMYGYEIVQAIAARTSAVVSPAEGVIYPVLHALEREGALKSRDRNVGGRSRVYYSLTRKGQARLTRITATWKTLNGAVGAVLEGGVYAV